MTALAAGATSDTAGVAHWRAYGLALLPLALLGLLPAWSCAALCVVYALGVRSARWAEARLMTTLVVTALSFILSVRASAHVGLGTLVVLATSYLIWTVAGVALNWGAMQVEDGQRRGLLPALVVGLLAPQPLLLLALAGGLAARPGPDDRRSDRVQQRRMWPWVGTVLMVLLLGAALLPRPVAPWLTASQTAGPQAPSQDRAAPSEDSDRRSEPDGAALSKPFQLEVDTRRLAAPLAALGVAVTLLLLALAVLTRPTLRGAGRRVPLRPIDVLMAAALLLTGSVWVVVAILLNSGGRGDASGAAAAAGAATVIAKWTAQLMNAPTTRGVDLTRTLQALIWLAVPVTVALMVLAVMRLRLPLGLRPDAPAAPEDVDRVDPSPEGALHRVRRAYREAESALTGTGRGRSPAETPAGYAQRLGMREPQLAAALDTLAHAYEPVRYGGRVSDDAAEQAEAAVRTLREVLPTLPRLEPGADAEPDQPAVPSNPKEPL
ncbi:DUF4129 domain-containing protein [Deinococcus hohokamensis]|uniref:DUF4129 domain-containing protein n=1 Tax=Deinococcus hohokamensis TaxID=309883 RepID=A0ABV9I6X1_9DEIO